MKINYRVRAPSRSGRECPLPGRKGTMIADRLHNFSDSNADFFGCLKLHVMPAVHDDQFAARREKSQLCLPFYPFFLQLGRRNVVLAIMISALGACEDYQRNR